MLFCWQTQIDGDNKIAVVCIEFHRAAVLFRHSVEGLNAKAMGCFVFLGGHDLVVLNDDPVLDRVFDGQKQESAAAIAGYRNNVLFIVSQLGTGFDGIIQGVTQQNAHIRGCQHIGWDAAPEVDVRILPDSKALLIGQQRIGDAVARIEQDVGVPERILAITQHLQRLLCLAIR